MKQISPLFRRSIPTELTCYWQLGRRYIDDTAAVNKDGVAVQVWDSNVSPSFHCSRQTWRSSQNSEAQKMAILWRQVIRLWAMQICINLVLYIFLVFLPNHSIWKRQVNSLSRLTAGISFYDNFCLNDLRQRLPPFANWIQEE